MKMFGCALLILCLLSSQAWACGCGMGGGDKTEKTAAEETK